MLPLRFGRQSNQPLIGESIGICELRENIVRYSHTDEPVFIEGAVGTELDTLVSDLHRSGQRAAMPLFSLNCAGTEVELLEQYLLRGRNDNEIGFLKRVSRATLLLEHVDCLSSAAQTRLAQCFFEEHSEHDVRLIATSTTELEKWRNRRLATVFGKNKLYVPLLRDRCSDSQLLASAFLKRFSEQSGKIPRTFSHNAMEAIEKYSWPGNVKELENVIERAVLLSNTTEIEVNLLAIEQPSEATVLESVHTSGESLKQYFVQFDTANEARYSETEIALKLGISRKSLWERRQRLNIPRKRTKQRRSIQ